MKHLSNQELKQLYTKYVQGRYFFRAVSSEYISDIKKNGLNPKNRPFEYFKKQLQQFLTLILQLHKNGYPIIYNWPHETPSTEKLVRVLRKDLTKNYIDLSTDGRHHKYYMKRTGGSLITTILELSKFIKKKRYPLTIKQQTLLESVFSWCKKRRTYSMKTIKIQRTSIYLEKAHFQHFGGKYWPSPFGRFEHFKKIILKEGIEKYLPRFEGKQHYYIRLSKDVPSNELLFE